MKIDNAPSPAKYLLVMDNFSGHTTQTVRAVLAKVDVEPLFLTSNTTAIMQSLDVS